MRTDRHTGGLSLGIPKNNLQGHSIALNQCTSGANYGRRHYFISQPHFIVHQYPLSPFSQFHKEIHLMYFIASSSICPKCVLTD